MVLSKRHILSYWLPIAMYIALILLWSIIPGLLIPLPPIQHADKLAHLAEYTLLGLLVARAFVAASPNRTNIGRWLLAIACVVCVGILDEATQSLVPHRCSDVNDLLADVGGALIGTAVYATWLRVRVWHRQPSSSV